MKLGVNLRRIRKYKNYTLRQLGVRTGLDHSDISKIERGIRTDVTIQTVIKLAAALEVSLDDLVLKDLSQK
ncbi:helix-turn-helix domain-containing protein [Erysipelothrix sp. HDW6A]|uniref:helix-turn-helix domain-containing protein n=1 Tax=Erysipelothrix sp. HDW6A TaxID=2714928 RepID=UPI00196B08B2|nr:helix-turn-helix transcriptional regulator [Erysipelothrix sp. HDW6A]